MSSPHSHAEPKKSSRLYTKWRVVLFHLRKIFLCKNSVAKIFVYGTLREKGRNFDQIKDLIISSQKGTVSGVLYVRKDKYVFLTSEKGVVVGELLLIKGGDAALRLFDVFEGREYQRKIVAVHTRTGVNTAYVYYYSGKIPPDSQRINSGDWIAFAQQSDQ